MPKNLLNKIQVLALNIHIILLHKQPLMLVQVNLWEIHVIIPTPKEKTSPALVLIRVISSYSVRGVERLHHRRDMLVIFKSPVQVGFLDQTHSTCPVI
jgi:hypothetical protein